MKAFSILSIIFLSIVLLGCQPSDSEPDEKPSPRLSSILINDGKIDFSFDPSIATYNLQLTNDIGEITIKPQSVDSNMSVSVNGKIVELNASTEAFKLNTGANYFSIEVGSGDLEKNKTYHVTVYRAYSSNTLLNNIEFPIGILSPVFNSDISTYKLSIPYNAEVNEITVATLDSTQTRLIEGLGNYSDHITIEVTAEDGISKRVYIIDVINLLPSPKELTSNDIYYIEVTKISDADAGAVEEISSAKFTGYATDNMSWKDCLWSASNSDGSCESGIETGSYNYIGETIQELAMVDGVLSSIKIDREEQIFEWVDQYNLMNYFNYYLSDEFVGRSGSDLFSMGISEIDLADISFSKAIYTDSDIKISSPTKLLTERFPTGSTGYLLDGKSNYTEFSYVNEFAGGQLTTISELITDGKSAAVYFCSYDNSNAYCNDYKLEFTTIGDINVLNVSVFDQSLDTYISRGTTQWAQVESYYGHNAITIADSKVAGYRSIIEMPDGLVGEIVEEYIGNNLSLNAVAEAAFEELLPKLNW